MRTVDVISTSRADYGILQPVLRALQAEPTVRLRVVASGMHLSETFGLTVAAIERDGFEIVARIEVLGSSDSPFDTAAAMGRAVTGFGRHFDRDRPDLVVVVGDRFEMHAAAVAALPFRVPVAHLHGGELSAGAFDDALRHSMTKLSHLHFVSTARARQRVLQLGEEPWRVTVSGAPSLDHLREFRLANREQIQAHTGLRVPERFVLITHHPATLGAGDVAAETHALFDAVASQHLDAVITMPNADPGGGAIRTVIEQRAHPPAIQTVEYLGSEMYFSLMALAAAVLGNSSSGIIEAASFGVPVVNVGPRQDGRERSRNVIDVGPTFEEIDQGLRRALSPAFRRELAGLTNPYGDGHAAERIVERLRSVELTPRLTQKRFVDYAEQG